MDLIDVVVDLIDSGYDMVICFGVLIDLMLIVWLLVLNFWVLCVLLVYVVEYGVLVYLVDIVWYWCIFIGD